MTRNQLQSWQRRASSQAARTAVKYLRIEENTERSQWGWPCWSRVNGKWEEESVICIVVNWVLLDILKRLSSFSVHNDLERIHTEKRKAAGQPSSAREESEAMPVWASGSRKEAGKRQGRVYPLCLKFNAAASVALTLLLNMFISFQSRTLIHIGLLWLMSPTRCGHSENVRGTRMQPAQLPSISCNQMTLVTSSLLILLSLYL